MLPPEMKHTPTECVHFMKPVQYLSTLDLTNIYSSICANLHLSESYDKFDSLTSNASGGQMSLADVPDIIIGRLPLYLRALCKMAAEGKGITSSQELGARLGISSAQIRKDLSQFGEFGKQGTGYNIEFLIDQLRRILQVNQVWDVALIGAGDLGKAIAHYGGFLDRGFQIVDVFDNDPEKVGQNVGKFVVKDTKIMTKEIGLKNIQVAMLAVPASEAQGIADELINAGILAILCYAPTSLKVPENVRIQYIDPVLHLQRMTYYLP
jgi:redox-sensing transcriptional repressor